MVAKRRPVERAFGRYELLEPIAQGGMAEVWRAKLIGAQQFERPMVIKRILPHLCHNPDFVKLFIAEARLTARLHHPNIVQVFELGDVDGELFMAIEYVHGVDLLDLLRAAKGPLPVGMALSVAHDVCRALAYADGVTDEHGNPLHIVHRDVSPSNVMLGYDGQIRLCDFGLARALGASDERSRTGKVVGKVSYLAPELLDGAPGDHRSDLWAVGVLLHELLTGRRLFRGQNDLETMALVRACQVRPPSALNPAVRPELDDLVLRALAQPPQQRPSADELSAELAPLLHQSSWGGRETARLVRELKPAGGVVEPSDAGALTRSATVAHRARSTPKPRRARWWVAATGVGVLMLAALAWVVIGAGRHRGPAVVPAPTATATANPAGNAGANGAAATNAGASGATATKANAGASGATAKANAGASGATATKANAGAPHAAVAEPAAPKLAVEPPAAVRAAAPDRNDRNNVKKRPRPRAKREFDIERGDVIDSL
jgi:serine/threonine-protein kinase